MSVLSRIRQWFHKLDLLGSKADANNPAAASSGTTSIAKHGAEPTAAAPGPRVSSNAVAAAPPSSTSQRRAAAHGHSAPPAQATATFPSATQQPQPAQPSKQQHTAASGPAAATRTKPTLEQQREEFFTEYGESNRYSILEVIGKGSYGIVCSALDNYTGEKVAIKKITNVFEHVSDATRILREIKLLRLLKHPDIVKIQHIMLPPSQRDYQDIYVVFELMETDLHQVIKANDDLTPEHHQFFLYQMLRGLKYLHSAKVFHRDLKPKNILANADCKLKICDFGLARPAFENMPTMIFWTDYVATRWYRAPELCGSFFAKYSPAIDIWGVGCIFAEVLLGRPLFPGKNVVNQLELITDLLGTPSQEVIAKVRNEKARRFLLNLPLKPGIPFTQVFPGVDRKALQLLRALLSFDPSERPTAEQALQHPYFAGLHNPAREPITTPVSKLAFDFDRRKLSTEEVRDLIYAEILEYHPQALASYQTGSYRASFSHPNALDNFKRMFLHLEHNPGAVLQPSYQGKARQSAVATAAAAAAAGAQTAASGAAGGAGAAKAAAGADVGNGDGQLNRSHHSSRRSNPGGAAAAGAGNGAAAVQANAGSAPTTGPVVAAGSAAAQGGQGQARQGTSVASRAASDACQGLAASDRQAGVGPETGLDASANARQMTAAAALAAARLGAGSGAATGALAGIGAAGAGAGVRDRDRWSAGAVGMPRPPGDGLRYRSGDGRTGRSAYASTLSAAEVMKALGNLHGVGHEGPGAASAFPRQRSSAAAAGLGAGTTGAQVSAAVTAAMGGFGRGAGKAAAQQRPVEGSEQQQLGDQPHHQCQPSGGNPKACHHRSSGSCVSSSSSSSRSSGTSANTAATGTTATVATTNTGSSEIGGHTYDAAPVVPICGPGSGRESGDMGPAGPDQKVAWPEARAGPGGAAGMLPQLLSPRRVPVGNTSPGAGPTSLGDAGEPAGGMAGVVTGLLGPTGRHSLQLPRTLEDEDGPCPSLGPRRSPGAAPMAEHEQAARTAGARLAARVASLEAAMLSAAGVIVGHAQPAAGAQEPGPGPEAPAGLGSGEGLAVGRVTGRLSQPPGSWAAESRSLSSLPLGGLEAPTHTSAPAAPLGALHTAAGLAAPLKGPSQAAAGSGSKGSRVGLGAAALAVPALTGLHNSSGQNSGAGAWVGGSGSGTVAVRGGCTVEAGGGTLTPDALVLSDRERDGSSGVDECEPRAVVAGVPVQRIYRAASIS